MSHNLMIQNGEASMMYVGGVPWHGLGTVFDKPATAEEAIQAARLDWTVKKLPLYASDGENSLLRLPVPDKYAVARENSLDVLGVVGSSYTPVQNREAFAFFDPIVGKQAAIYHTAGALGKGERVWILAKLPDSIRVVGDDITDKFLLLTNSHDGTSSLQVKFTPVRVVCQNTLTLAINNGQRGIKISHHTDIHQRLKAAEKMLGIVHHQFDELADTFREMVQVPMNGNRLETVSGVRVPGAQGPAAHRERGRVHRPGSFVVGIFLRPGGGQPPEGSRRHALGRVQRGDRVAGPP